MMKSEPGRKINQNRRRRRRGSRRIDWNTVCFVIPDTRLLKMTSPNRFVLTASDGFIAVAAGKRGGFFSLSFKNNSVNFQPCLDWIRNDMFLENTTWQTTGTIWGLDNVCVQILPGPSRDVSEGVLAAGLDSSLPRPPPAPARRPRRQSRRGRSWRWRGEEVHVACVCVCVCRRNWEAVLEGDTRVALSCKVLHLCTEMSQRLDKPTRKAHPTRTWTSSLLPRRPSAAPPQTETRRRSYCSRQAPLNLDDASFSTAVSLTTVVFYTMKEGKRTDLLCKSEWRHVCLTGETSYWEKN